MNPLHLALRLSDISAQGFQRHYFQHQLGLLEHDSSILFSRRPPPTPPSPNIHEGEDVQVSEPAIAHRAGVNCLAADQTQGRYLISGGADTFIRLWDLETSRDSTEDGDGSGRPTKTYHAVTSISKATAMSHTHSITSLSIYPHDPVPQTLLTTSYDQSLLLSSITPTSLVPLHSFPLDFTVYTHTVSPHPAQPLVAVGTLHPAPRLIDLRTALATHSLPGHHGAIYSLAWHPKRENILVSSSTDGRILVFDIRRATPAFASFSLDDSLGVADASNTNRHQLDFSHRAHEAPITGILFNEFGDKLISAAQDQRIRVWDVATGESDLVHFGPRIRNSAGREGESKPVLLPRGMAGASGMKSGREVLLWPNDDGRGEVFVCEIREGSLRSVLKTKANRATVAAANTGRGGSRGRGRGSAGRGGSNNSLTSRTNAATAHLIHGGRINGLAFRPVLSDEGLGQSLEMFSAHGDGRIRAWSPTTTQASDDIEQDQDDEDDDDEERVGAKQTEEEIAAEKSRKRKRELIEGLVEGLTKRPVTFS